MLPWLLRLVASVSFAAPGIAAAVDLPANLRVDGVIGPSAGAPRVTPAQNDKILIIHGAKGSLEAVGEVVDGGGTYFVMIGKDTSFNNTPLTIQLQKPDQSIYQLLDRGRPASFVFQGGLFPSRLNLQLSVGPGIGAPASGKPAAPQPAPLDASAGDRCTDPRMDVNGDGVCDQADIEIIKAYIAGQTRTIGTGARREDVNGDNVVNSRDLIDAMRAMQKRPGAQGTQ